MKTFTLRGIEDALDARLKAAAKEESMSINQWILKTLRQVVGLEKDPFHTKRNHDLDNLFGTWDEEEFKEFQRTQASFEKIDEEMWK